MVGIADLRCCRRCSSSVLAVRRLIVGPEAEGLFTLFGIVFFLIGIALFGIGLLGEYVGRIYQQVRQRPRYLVEAMLESASDTRLEPARCQRCRLRLPQRRRALPVGAAAHGVEVPLVVTHQDNPNENIWFDSVAATRRAARHPGRSRRTIPTRPKSSRGSRRCAPDFLFSFYYRQMLKTPLLALAARGAFNMHGSLLPKYRGRVPVNWAVHPRRDAKPARPCTRWSKSPTPATSSTSRPCPSCPTTPRCEVFDKVTVAAEIALDRVLPALLAGTAPRSAAGSRARAAISADASPRTAASTGRRRAQSIHNLVRAVAPPYPGAFTRLAGKPLRVLQTLLRAGRDGRAAPAPGALLRERPLLRRMRRRQRAARARRSSSTAGR